MARSHAVLPRVFSNFHHLASMRLYELEKSLGRMVCQRLEGDMFVEERPKHVIEECFCPHRGEVVRDIHRSNYRLHQVREGLCKNLN
jgi:hypothetical protein